MGHGVEMKGHKGFCFAGQATEVLGYFPEDVLPCVCGAAGDATAALSQLALPAAVCETPAGRVPAAPSRAIDFRAAAHNPTPFPAGFRNRHSTGDML